MNRRLIVATVIAIGLGGAAAAPAMAGSPDTTSHKLCVALPHGNPTVPSGDGICINWAAPAQPQQ